MRHCAGGLNVKLVICIPSLESRLVPRKVWKAINHFINDNKKSPYLCIVRYSEEKTSAFQRLEMFPVNLSYERGH